MKSSKKRCRKSKLVPRECLDSDDENIADMQREIEQTIARMTTKSILKKLNQQTKEPIKFSIKVEVEEVDEPVVSEIEEAEMEKEMNIAIDSVVSLKETNTDIKKTLSYKNEVAILRKDLDVIQFKEELIRREFNKVSKQTTSIADKLIEIHILNFFGRYSPAIKLNDKDLKLHLVIEKWQSWHRTNPKHRDVPLLYKCYICSKAWWHYYDFRQHFHTHDQGELHLEYSAQECSVVIFQNEWPYYDIVIDGTCWQCGQDFSLHRAGRKGNKIYRCKGCLKRFMSCTLLHQHLGYCVYFKRTLEKGGVKTNDVFSCRICPVKYFSEIELDKHLTTRHLVRSDVPVVSSLQNCLTCNHQLIDEHSHECHNLLFTKHCEFCKRNFQKESNLRMHQTVVKKNHKCIVCGKILMAECMELEHLLSHSNVYTMVYKCKICPDSMYILNKTMMNKHKIACHKQHNNDVKICFFEAIVVPKTLLKNPPLKTYFGKGKLKSNNEEYEQSQEKIVCDDSEMGILDFSESDNKKFNVEENVDIPIQGEFEMNFATVKTNIDAVKTKIDEATSTVNEESTNICGVSNNIHEVSTNICEVSNNIDEESHIIEVSTNIVDEKLTNINKVSTSIDEVSVNINIGSNNIDFFNIKIKKEKQDIEADFNNEYLTDINIKQEPMEIEFSKKYKEDNMNDTVIKEEFVEHFSEVCDLNNAIKIEVNNESVDDLDNDYEDNDTIYDDSNDKDFKLLYGSKRIYSCNKCPYKGIHSHYKEHVKGLCLNSFYTCTKCNLKYGSMKSYLYHFQETHNYVPDTCPECLQQLPMMAKLTAHVYQHIKNNFVSVHFIKEKTFNKCYQCRQCRENVSSSDFFMHWESHIEIKNVGTGSEAVDLLENKPILQDVISLLQSEIPKKTKEIGPKQCVMCLKLFSRKNDLKRHLIEHLLRDAYLQKDKYDCLKCQICSIGFNKIDIYKRHMRDHASLPLYKCEICDKTFSDSSNFSKHKKVHNLCVMLCDICKKKFTCKAYLIKHMELHEQLKPIVCGCCSRVFHSQSSYRKHRVQNRYKCPVCFNTYTSLKDKWDHMWLKHKERKYLADCPICKKSFRKYQEVKMHIKTMHDNKYVYKADFVKINKNEIIICE